jgi:sigma-B regulation protein RsbU (phosphoserine phosphatase)
MGWVFFLLSPLLAATGDKAVDLGIGTGCGVLAAILAGSWGWFFWRNGRQSRLLETATRAREKIEREETRVFDFLHGLGEAFLREVRPEDLHRLIVEGAIRILDAHGGALYIADRESNVVKARFISKSCPPLIEVPPHILQEAESKPQALQNFLRLHVIKSGDGLVGKVWRDKEPILLSQNDARLAQLHDTTLRTESAMLAPLLFAKENLGVLAVANGPMSTPFTDSDFSVFKAIAEQSAFALYNTMIYSLAAEKMRLDEQVLVAQEIQRILLPSSAPTMQSYEIDGMNQPALQMSGDYYGYIKIDDSHWGIAIADVAGKGVPASLVMAMCRATLRGHATNNPNAADVLHRVNRQLYPDIKEDMFISMAYLILDDHSNVSTLCRAGHDAPLLYSARSRTVQKINPPGMALGIDRGDVFDRITGDFQITMEPNDCLILYTDGVTEALDGKGEEFGLARVIHSIQASADQGAAGIKIRLTDDLKNFTGAKPPNDDITMIVIRKK